MQHFNDDSVRNRAAGIAKAGGVIAKPQKSVGKARADSNFRADFCVRYINAT